jgi:hypothetical protein
MRRAVYSPVSVALDFRLRADGFLEPTPLQRKSPGADSIRRQEPEFKYIIAINPPLGEGPVAAAS